MARQNAIGGVWEGCSATGAEAVDFHPRPVIAWGDKKDELTLAVMFFGRKWSWPRNIEERVWSLAQLLGDPTNDLLLPQPPIILVAEAVQVSM